jgi:hypothetical protein
VPVHLFQSIDPSIRKQKARKKKELQLQNNKLRAKGVYYKWYYYYKRETEEEKKRSQRQPSSKTGPDRSGPVYDFAVVKAVMSFVKKRREA